MSAPPKVLFVGLDSADPELLARGCEEGWLPAFKKFRDAGAWAAVEVPRAFGQGAIWPSLATGVNPGRHGRYFYRQIRLGTYRIEDFRDDSHFGHSPLWESVSRAGRRVVIIDMPRAPFSRAVNGMQICDWMAHDGTGPPRSKPAEAAADAITRFGVDPLGGHTDIPRGRTAEEYRILRDKMIERVRAKTAACEHYIEQKAWDLFMVAYADPHDVAHQCWHLHDPTHAGYDRRWVERYGDPVKDVYRELDSALARLLACVGPDTTTVVFAGPGMGPDYTGNFLFDRLLRRLDGRSDRDRNLIPHAIVSRLRPAALRRLGERVNRAKHRYNMSRRKFFAIPHNENAGAVRINVRGREPAGRIGRGAEYDAVCAALTRDLLALVNTETGRPVVAEVVRVAEECHGDLIDTLPDLLVVWSREAPIRSVSSPKAGVVTGTPVVGARTGDHNADCLVLLQGPDVKTRGRIRSVRVEDIAPTMASFLGVALRDADGAPIAFDDRSTAAATS